MFWYRLEAGLLVFRQLSKENTKWLMCAIYYFDLIGNFKFTLSMFSLLQVAYAEGQTATTWPAKLAAWAKLRMAFFTVHYLFAKSNFALLALQEILHPSGAKHVEALTAKWVKPFDGFARQMKKLFGEWWAAWGKMVGIAPEKTAEWVDSFGVWKEGENLQHQSFRWLLWQSLWAFTHWEIAADTGTWAVVWDGKKWDAAKWHKYIELRTMKWFGVTAKLIGLTRMIPRSTPHHEWLETLVPWQGMYISYMGAAIAYHNAMASKPAEAASQPKIL